MHEIHLDIKLIPTPDGRHDMDIEMAGIDTDEVEDCLLWVVAAIRENKRCRLKVIK